MSSASTGGGFGGAPLLCRECVSPIAKFSRFCSNCGAPAPGREPWTPATSPQGREIYGRLEHATRGKYEIVRELGRGGMAVVFLAHQTALDRAVAIKVLLPALYQQQRLVERFQREARTAARLDHPNIVSVFEVYSDERLAYFTMGYVLGRNLATHLRHESQPHVRRVQRYLAQSAQALAYAHRHGVVHRDVKPGNILLDNESDRVTLTDFGIAKACLSEESTLTTPGDVMGTPSYMAPEQGDGTLEVDGRADQYSLGVIGYEMLAGRRPFVADSVPRVMYLHRFEEPRSLHELRPTAPKRMRQAIHRAMSKEPADRFPTMEDFLAALGDEEPTTRRGSPRQLPTLDTTPLATAAAASDGEPTPVEASEAPDLASRHPPLRPPAEPPPEPGARAPGAGPPDTDEKPVAILVDNETMAVREFEGPVFVLEPRAALDRDMLKASLEVIWASPRWTQPWGFVIAVHPGIRYDRSIRKHEMPPNHLRAVGTAIVSSSSIHRMVANSIGLAYRMVDSFYVSGHETTAEGIERQRAHMKTARDKGTRY